MDIIQHFYKLFAYDEWANREALESLKSVNFLPTRSLRLMGHIIAVEWLWLARLKHDKRAIQVWPELTINQCESQMGGLPEAWKEYLNEQTPERLDQSVSYTNSKGESWSNSVGDILTQTIMHSVYHRGQIAADLRATDHAPAYTDYIHCTRQEFI